MTQYLLLFCLCSAIALGQRDSTDTDSTSSGAAPRGIYIGKGGISISSGSLAFNANQPSLSIEYGNAFPGLKGISTTIAQPRLIELYMGTLDITSIPNTTTVIRTARSGLFGGVFSPDYGGKTDSTSPQVEGWRVGLFFTSGYAYTRAEKEPSLSLLHNGGLVWTSLNIKKLPSASPDSAALFPFSDHVRFGNQTGFSLHYAVSSAISLNLSYERTLMYNDFSFFRWLGSTTVEGIAQGLLQGMVVSKIEEKSPASAPVANLLLRSALSFALYELRRSNQHFPFGGNSPLSFDALRVGITFNY